MADVQRIVRIFVASPVDVGDERALLEEVVREFNRTWSHSLGLRYELIRWETDAFPEAGTDPQQVINKQIGDDYDIFIGILWARFGTPTPRAASGTMEEFQRAFRKHQTAPESVSLMIYFSDEKLSPTQMRPQDLDQLQRFREGLGEQGVLWWSYPDKSDFSQLLRTHLGKQAQVWKEKLNNSPSAPTAPAAGSETDTSLTPPQTPSNDEEDEGILDLVEAIQDDIASLTTNADRIAAATEEIGAKFRERSTEIDRLRQQGNPLDVRRTKRVIGDAADDMNAYATRLEAETPEFAATYARFMDRIVRVELLRADFPGGKEGNRTPLEGIGTFLQQITGARDHIVDFRNTVAATPRLTSELNRARRNTVDALDRLAAEFSKAILLASDLEPSDT